MISLPGYQLESRDVDVGSSPQELPAVVLRPIVGTLYVLSEPAGASVSVDGKKFPKPTPAQLQLTPGKYNITVERNGRQATQTVTVGTSISSVTFKLE
jgi:hypothetical protein